MKRKNGVLYTLLIMVLVYTVLTWILPITVFNGEFASQGMSRMGISELLSYPTYAFYNFIYILMYLGIGCGIYGILRNIPAYRNLVAKIVKFIKNEELLFMILVISLFSIVVAFTGFVYEALMIMPFIATVLLKAGKDKYTAALTTVGPIAVGVMGNLFSSSVAGTFVNGLSIEYTDLIIAKLLFLVLGIVALVVMIRLHQKKDIKEESNDDVFFLYQDERNDKKARVWPLVTTLIVFMVIKIVSTIAWKDAFGIIFFNDLKTDFDAIPLFTKYIAFILFGLIIIGLLVKYIINKRKDNSKKFREVLGKVGFIVFIVSSVIVGLVFVQVLFEDVFKVTKIFTNIYNGLSLDGITFGTLIGAMNAFGSWTYAEYIVLALSLAIILMIAYRIKPCDAVDNLEYGFRGGVYALVLCMLGYVLLVLSSNNPIMLTILKPLLTLTKGFNVLTYSIASFIGGIFNSDLAYINYGIVNLNYVTTTFADKTNLFPLVGLINQSMIGLALLVAPTSVPVIFSLGTLNYSYKEWIKNIWKLFLMLFIVALLINVVVLVII